MKYTHMKSEIDFKYHARNFFHHLSTENKKLPTTLTVARNLIKTLLQIIYLFFQRENKVLKNKYIGKKYVQCQIN